MEVVNHVRWKIKLFSDCPSHCSLCWNETECYECTQGFYLDGESSECESEYKPSI